MTSSGDQNQNDLLRVGPSAAEMSAALQRLAEAVKKLPVRLYSGKVIRHARLMAMRQNYGIFRFLMPEWWRLVRMRTPRKTTCAHSRKPDT